MFTPTKAMQMVYKGISLETLGLEAGPEFMKTVNIASGSIEKKYPRVAYAQIQGTMPHTSSRDESDEQKVVTVGYHTSSGTRLLSIHARNNRTWKEFFSRHGKTEAAISASLQKSSDAEASNAEEPNK
ncbi:conserved hypothetical protein [Histoplasma capsulatum G186AR]|uniref:Uncharacterized protein n=1 Tax=Ajellomyces capsulatus (strain G186AR / H82 / ATCC MYA-2454 / RMSCC 2432) TaxID=447093 RepID=C0NZ83_AJECG|nr:uncharacterized protein HCBG_08463 [Histoplasma capsulatum G186AR]EEH03131.1 conserved hypothetical protein [Histoplasma capsulatum G186AR]